MLESKVLFSFIFGVALAVLVVEARSKQGVPKLVERWGEPDSAKCVVAVSVNDRNSNPVCVVLRGKRFISGNFILFLFLGNDGVGIYSVFVIWVL